MPAKIKNSQHKQLINQNIRLPLDVVIFLDNEKGRTGIPKERLVLNALLGKYPIRNNHK